MDDLTPEQRRVNSQKTVLIVEDNELNMRLFHDIMEMQGYNILQTTNGMDAFKLTRRHRPDLIVKAIQLPEVSGLEVTRWIKEDDNLKSTPIIAVTAFALRGDDSKILQSGCEAYLAKPITIDLLLETIQSFMG